MLTLKIDGDLKEFIPGQVVAGHAGWDLAQMPEDAFLRLIWYTQGRGTQDVSIVEEVALSVDGLVCEHSFQFTLPAAPYSFSGPLISLQWAIELVVDREKDSVRLDIVVSPWTEIVKLQSIEMK